MDSSKQTDGQALLQWSSIDWAAAEANVRQLQGRIFRAAKDGQKAQVKNLQKLLVRSQSAKKLAIRQVTQQNAGKNMPGVDGVVCSTPTARVKLMRDGLALQGYRPKPVRRVLIPKAAGKMRPLGIPTIKDRVMQALVKMALEPEWEPRFEANSYGFRPGRCTMDAMQAIHIALSRRGSSKWILDADIAGCFDNIAHKPLLAKLPTFHKVVERWLRAGVVANGKQEATLAGTPQGGIISPLLANIALDGLERLFGCEDQNGQIIGSYSKKGLDKSLMLIRYADDFVVTAPSKEILEKYVVPKLVEFLATKGLTLNPDKTRVVHVEQGFDFLGCEVRKFHGEKLIIRPQKSKVLAHLSKIGAYLRANKAAPADKVVKDLAPQIRGWANYYHHVCASHSFAFADHRVWQMLWVWAVRRHPLKNLGWVKSRYFRRHNGRDWTFGVLGDVTYAKLPRHCDTKILRHPKVVGKMSPHDPDARAYWHERRRSRMASQPTSQRRKNLLAIQNFTCTVCGVPFDPLRDSGLLDIHHIVPRHRGGGHDLSNLRLLHRWCHHQHHQISGYRAAEA